MKKTITVLLILILSLSLISACGGGNRPQAPPVGQPAPEQSTPQQSAPAQSAPEKAPGGQLAAAYIDILSAGKYYMKYHMEMDLGGQKMDAVMEVAKDGDNMAVITAMAGMGSSAIIIKDGKSYIVNHESKTVTTIPVNAETQKQSAIPQTGFVFKGSGSAELFGVAHNYEEYGTDEGDMRFFFEGGKLIGLETAAGGQKVQMEILEMSGAIPSGMMDIPADYTVTETSGLMDMFALPDMSGGEIDMSAMFDENGEIDLSFLEQFADIIDQE